MSDESKPVDSHKDVKPDKWQERAEEYLNGWKRAKADYINLKKETDKKLMESAQYANAALIIQMLPVNDHFKLAMEHIPEAEKEKDWVKGIIHIRKEFQDLLRQFGIEEIPTIGKNFDPELHEAVTKEKADGVTTDQIIKEVQPGYKLFNKVLQHAKVVVAE
ncbi:MAG: nucleotide exchange factor GrpE [Candidatus Kerfeldbacteria bacterium CG08_land_8_20_14_0_20_42_7]|uniref:Protein GrpE n=1 Tax=Candidatus Kerfeldbacteria bacterium CG08_land_8_20_14_0_20_42_7 TaxID=2014245 RepID=A0A2H0YRQ9_9BACT|nr:MAG: nucleotide exchange factor GrpE [Candidatus Kerfeldbacteria bacterium CG08_land_8_20_14_0_20_42_7]